MPWHFQCLIGSNRDLAVQFCVAVCPAHVPDAVLKSSGTAWLDVHSRGTALQRGMLRTRSFLSALAISTDGASDTDVAISSAFVRI